MADSGMSRVVFVVLVISREENISISQLKEPAWSRSHSAGMKATRAQETMTPALLLSHTLCHHD